MNFNKQNYPQDISNWIDNIEFIGVYNSNLTEFKQVLDIMKDSYKYNYLTFNETSLKIENQFRVYEFKYDYLFKYYKLLNPGLRYIINSDGISYLLINLEEEINSDLNKDATLLIENNSLHCRGYDDTPIEEWTGYGILKKNITEEKYNSLNNWLIKLLDDELDPDAWNAIRYYEQLYIRRIN